MSVMIVKELEDGWDKGCNLSCAGVAKGGEIFGVDGLDDMLNEGYIEK